MLKDNIISLRERIDRAASRAGRKPGEIRLVCVTKEAEIKRVEEAISFGCGDIGENRIREAIEKYNTIGTKAIWHLIGHLQRNKVRDALKVFSLIHSVDSEPLAREIDKEALKTGKVQDILVEVDISGEAGKYGIAPQEAAGFVEKLSSYPNIHIAGLMGIAPMVDVPEKARPYFASLKRIFDDLASRNIKNTEMKYLSMGMSQDFEVAIEEGSNMVRIGSAIFGR